MIATKILALLPIVITAATVVVVMLSVSIKRHHLFTAMLTASGLTGALLLTFALRFLLPETVNITALLVIDEYTLFGYSCVLLATLGCATLSYVYLDGLNDNREEMYLLLLIAAVGGLVLVSACNLASFFIGLELISVPIYGMLGYLIKDRLSLEASIKYLVLSAGASTFLLFGMALVYADSGTLAFNNLPFATDNLSPLFAMGVGMMLVAIAFKLSLAPFHLWTPDVYQGAPAPVGAFLATVSKIALFLVVMRLWNQVQLGSSPFATLIAVLAGLSMIVGNLLALRQANIKRLLAYSSIAHFGYLLVALLAGNEFSLATVKVYLMTYLAATLCAFGVLTLLSSPYRGSDARTLADLRGLFWQRPWLTAIFTIAMLSLAGVPLSAGFIAKFMVVATGVESELWWLVGLLVLGSAIAIYYYLRVIITLFMALPGKRRLDAAGDWGQRAGGILTFALALFILVAGLYPQPLLDLLH